MWWILLTVVLGLSAALVFDLVRQATARDRVAWRDSAAAAAALPWSAEEAAGRPVLLRFTADWCGPCRQMTAEVFSDLAVAEQIEAAALPVVVDLTRPDEPQQALAQRYDVQAIPQLLLVEADGTERARLAGAVDREAFIDWLGRHTGLGPAAFR